MVSEAASLSYMHCWVRKERCLIDWSSAKGFKNLDDENFQMSKYNQLDGKNRISLSAMTAAAALEFTRGCNIGRRSIFSHKRTALKSMSQGKVSQVSSRRQHSAYADAGDRLCPMPSQQGISKNGKAYLMDQLNGSKASSGSGRGSTGLRGAHGTLHGAIVGQHDNGLVNRSPAALSC